MSLCGEGVIGTGVVYLMEKPFYGHVWMFVLATLIIVILATVRFIYHFFTKHIYIISISLSETNQKNLSGMEPVSEWLRNDHLVNLKIKMT